MAAPPITERHLPHFHRRAPVLEAVRVATTANITISTALNNGDTLDGVSLVTGDRVLVKDQSTASQNGIYEVGASPARAYDLSTDDPNFGFLVYVKAGTANAGTLWHNANTSAPTVGSSSITFAQVTADTTDLTTAVFGYQAHGNLGSTETFDATAAGWHSGTLNADCTFTFTAQASGTVSTMVLELTQDGTGGWDITLPGSVVGDFSGYDTTAGTTSLLMFFSRDGGTTWFGFIAGGSGTAVAALDDLTDVTITAAAADDTLRYSGSAWVNDNRRWEPVTFDPGTGPEIVFTATDIVMTWETY